MSEENVEACERRFETLQRGDIDAVPARTGSRRRGGTQPFVEVARRQAYQGREGVRNGSEDFDETWDDRGWSSRKSVEHGDRRRRSGRISARGNASGVEVEMPLRMVWTSGTAERRSVCSSSTTTKPSKPPGCRSRRCRRRTWSSCVGRWKPLIGATGAPGSRSAMRTSKWCLPATGRSLECAAPRPPSTGTSKPSTSPAVPDHRHRVHRRRGRQSLAAVPNGRERQGKRRKG